MTCQIVHLGSIVVRYESGDTWFDGSLHVSPAADDPSPSLCIDGTDAIVALRNFLNCLDFSGRRLTVVKPKEGRSGRALVEDSTDSGRCPNSARSERQDGP